MNHAIRAALWAWGLRQINNQTHGGVMGVKLGTAVTTVVALLLGMVLTADAANVRVRCEKRADRSKISVDGNDLVPANGQFTARATSGGNTARSGAQTAVAGEAEFDFDSNANDVAAGATRISASFIQRN